MMLLLPEYMATWVMGLAFPASLKNTRSPGRRSDFATLSPILHCATGSSGSVSHLLKTLLVRQEQSDRALVNGGRVPRCLWRCRAWWVCSRRLRKARNQYLSFFFFMICLFV